MGSLSAQSERVDSLLRVLSVQTNPADSLDLMYRVTLLLDQTLPPDLAVWEGYLSEQFERVTDPTLRGKTAFALGWIVDYDNRTKEALTHLERAEELLTDQPDLQALVQTIKLRGMLEGRIGRGQDSRTSFRRGLLVAQRDSLATIPAQIDLHNDLGIAYFQQGLLESAANHFHRAQLLSQSSNLPKRYGQASIYLSYIHFRRREWALGIQNARNALYSGGDRLEDGDRMFYYYTLAGGFRGQESVDSAVVYSRMAVNLAEERADPFNLVQMHLGMAQSYLYAGQPLAADFHIERAAEFVEETPENRIRYENFFLLVTRAERAQYAGETARARELFEQARAAAHASDMNDYKRKLYRDAYRAYKMTGDSETALVYFEALNHLRDTLLNNRISTQLSELNVKYQTREKDLLLRVRTEDLARKKTGNRYLVLIAVLLVLLVGVIIRTLRLRRRANRLLRAQKQQLEQLDAAKSRFFSNITHELRTPLTLILGPLENATAKTKNPTLLRDLDTASSQGKKLLHLVNEILELTKLENGHVRVKPTFVDLRSMLRRTVFAYHSHADANGVLLSFDYQLPANVDVETDAAKLEHIVKNLLSGALRRTRAGNAVAVRVSATTPEEWQLEVSDTGRNLPTTTLNRLFDEYFRAEAQPTDRTGESGVSLALVKELTAVLGSKLDVESSEAHGTTFRLRLPLRTRPAESAPPERMEPALVPTEETRTEAVPVRYEPVSFDNSKPRLLIAEDNPEMGEYLVRILASEFCCVVAPDGVAALEQLQRAPFDLVTSDVMMPRMDGFELVERIRGDARFSDLPVVLLTARTPEADRLRGLRLGTDDYITKPFSARELIARIRNLLDNRNKRREWMKKNAKAPAEELPTNANEALLRTAEERVLANLTNSGYRVDELANDLAYSRRQVARILKRMTGMSPAQFIREVRLRRAYALLESQQYHTVAEAAAAAGFDDPSYFTKVFRKRYGKRPTEVLSDRVLD